MTLKSLLKPFLLAAMMGLLGFLVFGGQIWIWVLAVWLGSAPVVIWWNFQFTSSDRSNDSATVTHQTLTETDNLAHAEIQALATTCEPAGHEIHNRLNKDFDIGRD